MLGKALAPRDLKTHAEKLDVSYAVKVRHLRNEFEVGRKLVADGDMPVVRMYELRSIRRCFLPLGYDLIMEYIDGSDLGDRRCVRMLSMEDKINYFYQTAVALKFIHRAGYVHLDMKPSNIMISGGRVKLIDFGMTVPLGHKPKRIAGTSGFLSPEQFVRDYVNEATDVFALGVTFGVVFGGRKLRQDPQAGKERFSSQEARYHLETGADPVIDNVPDARSMPELAALISACTVPRRDKRVGTCDQVIAALERLAGEANVRLTPPC